MELTRLNCAMAIAFGLGGVALAPVVAIAGGLPSGSSLTGSLNVPTAQSSPGPIFTLTDPQQIFYTSLSPPFSPYAEGNLSDGIMGVQATIGLSTGAIDALASDTFSTTITNSGSAPETNNFNFYISGATLISDPLYGFMSGPGTDDAKIGINIAVDGVSQFAYGAELYGSASGSYSGEMFSLAPTSNALSYSETDVQGTIGEMYTFEPYSGVISLGTLNPGQSETLTYTLSGETFTDAGSGGLAFYGGSLAQIGDPFGVTGSQQPAFSITPAGAVSAVPETSTEVMLGTGLALLAGLAVRRRRLAEGFSDVLPASI